MYKNDTQRNDGIRNESKEKSSGTRNISEESNDCDDNVRGEKYSSLDDDADSDGEVERVLSQSLLKLSIIDRNAILEEIHGVRCLAVKESPELIQRSLEEFQKELDKKFNENGFSNKYGNNKKAYCLIRKRREQENPSRSLSAASSNRDANLKYSYNYAMDDDEFRLRFLRCDLFDVKKAVLRFCNYLDYIYELYGKVALERPIRLADFTKTELKMFRKGYFQFLPFRDSSGRRVIIVVGGMAPHEEARTRDKILFYLFDVATRDSIESQQRGFIIIRMIINSSPEDMKKYLRPNGDNTGRSITSIFHSLDTVHRTMSSIPSRLVALHVHVPNHSVVHLMFRIMVLKGLSGQNAYLRPRLIPHSNVSGIEMRYRLKSFGISTQSLPLTDTNAIKYNHFNQWIKIRNILDDLEFRTIDHDETGTLQVFETNSNTTKIKSDSDAQESGGISRTARIIATDSIVECPGLNDVVFRKGSRVTSIENPGNRFFRDLIRTFLEEKERTLEQLRQVKNFEHPTEAACDSSGSASNGGSLYGAKIGPAVAEAAPRPFPSGSTTTTSQFDGKKNTGKAFCDWLVSHIDNECNGRFLEWNTQIGGWIVMRDKNQITRKVSITLYNWGKRVSAEITAAKQQQSLNEPSSIPTVSDRITKGIAISPLGFVHGINSNINTDANMIGTDISSSGYGGDSDTCAFNNAQRLLPIQQEQCFISSFPCNDTAGPVLPTRSQKRPRNDSDGCFENKFNIFR